MSIPPEDLDWDNAEVKEPVVPTGDGTLVGKVRWFLREGGDQQDSRDADAALAELADTLREIAEKGGASNPCRYWMEDTCLDYDREPPYCERCLARRALL